MKIEVKKKKWANSVELQYQNNESWKDRRQKNRREDHS